MDALCDRAEIQTAVLRQIQRSGQCVDAIGVLRVNAQIGVIERAEVDVRITTHGPPMRTGIVRAPQLTFCFCLADYVHNVWITRRHRHADPIHVALGQANVAILAGQSLPRIATVHRFIHRGIPATGFQMPRPAAIGIHPRVQNVGIRRIGRDVGARRLRIDKQHAFPRRAAVGCPEHPALLARPPLAPDAAHKHDVVIARVDDDAGDFVALLEANFRPVLTGVDGFVHTVPDRRIVAWIALAGADVDDVRVGWRDRDRTD